MKSSKLNRRDFGKLSAAAFGGMVAGASVLHLGTQEASAAESHLLSGKNVCRGLNHSCGGHKGGDNKCAGQGACATATAHACHTHNDCKGQGGCGSNPGENDCKGQGKCAVPLSDGAWKKARANFEKAMTAAGKKFGPAPAK